MKDNRAILEMLHGERFVNNGSPTGLTWTHSSSAATCPRRSGPRFVVPTLRLQAPEVESLGETPEPFRLDGEVLLPVHPDCVHLLGRDLHRRMLLEDGPDLAVIPTASPRTVYARSGSWRGFVKLDYPLVLGRFPRPLSGIKLFQGVWVSEYLRGVEAHLQDVLHFPETAALEASLAPGRRGGALFRDTSPTGSPFDRYVTFCSLFGVDHFDPGTPPMIVALSREHGGVTWITERVVLPLIRTFWTLVSSFGLWPEPHAQNIVLGVRPDGSTGVIWRDCQGFSADPTASPHLLERMHRVHSGQAGIERRSYLYDTMLATYVLDPLIEAVETAYIGVGPALRSAIVDEAQTALRRHAGADVLPIGQAFTMSLEAPQGRFLPFVPSLQPRYR